MGARTIWAKTIDEAYLDQASELHSASPTENFLVEPQLQAHQVPTAAVTPSPAPRQPFNISARDEPTESFKGLEIIK